MSTRVLDLFCGAGGSSQGAVQAGATLVGAIDAWDIATRTLRDNHPGAEVMTERLCARTKVAEALVRTGVDLLLASPECTNHSVAKGARPRDEESRRSGNYVLNFIRELGPRWVVLENVIQMRDWDGYDTLLRRIERMGYRIREQVLDASWFGVPQTRRRLFVLCELGRQPEPLPILRPPCTAASTFIDLSSDRWASRPLYLPGRAGGTLERAGRAIDALGPGHPFLVVYYGSDGAGGWQAIDRPIRTLTTLDRFGLVTWRNGEPWLRMLQVEELRAAMGFPQSYRFQHGTRRDRVKLLGNGVCPPVMEAVVRHLTTATVPGAFGLQKTSAVAVAA